MTGAKDAQVLVKMSYAQRDQLAEMARRDGVPVRAYVLHTLFGVSYEDLPTTIGGQPRHKRRGFRNQPQLPDQEVPAA